MKSLPWGNPIATDDVVVSQGSDSGSRGSWYDLGASRRECDQVLELRRKVGKKIPRTSKRQEARKGNIGSFRKLQGKY